MFDSPFPGTRSHAVKSGVYAPIDAKTYLKFSP